MLPIVSVYWQLWFWADEMLKPVTIIWFKYTYKVLIDANSNSH